MSQQQPDEDQLQILKFILNFFQEEPTEVQRKIIRSIENNQKTLIVSGNGVGKSFAVAIAKLGFLLTVPDSKVIGTSGSYSQYRDSVWNPMAGIYENLKQRSKESSVEIPGTVQDHKNQLTIDRNWYAKIISPQDPGDLEGRHARRVLIVIEEADKKYITEEHFDSAFSSVTDPGDRFVAIANPPEDQSGEVWRRMQPDSDWNVITFSSFESHNVRKRQKEIDGLITLEQIKNDYENWNDKPWPGVEKAREIVDIARITYQDDYELTDAQEERLEGLNSRWYRRRLGVIPPESSSIHRPLYARQVQDAYVREIDNARHDVVSYAYDVARGGGDRNVIISFAGLGRSFRVEDSWSGTDHKRNKEKAREVFNNNPRVDIAIDATGEGSSLADDLRSEYSNAFRFQSQEVAYEEDKYRDRWTEGLNLLGTAFSAGTNFDDDRIKRESEKAAAVVKFKEKYYKSRETSVFDATSKQKIEEELGHSPDFLDATYMAAWSAQYEHKKVPDALTWGT